MELLVACHDDKDYSQTFENQKNNRLLTSDMLNQLTELKRKDPDMVSALLSAAARKDMGAIVSIVSKKFNPLKMFK